MNCCDVFPLSFFILFLYFLKLYLSIFFLILNWLRIWFCYFFSLKHCWLLQCFSAWFFFLQNYLFFILFFNIELVKNYSYNIWGKHCNFFLKITVDCYSVFSHMVFFLIFFKLFQFYFFNIKLFVNYNYKSLQIRLNHVGKHCSFHHKTLWIAIVFPTWFFFLFLVFVLFFFSLNSLSRFFF